MESKEKTEGVYKRSTVLYVRACIYDKMGGAPHSNFHDLRRQVGILKPSKNILLYTRHIVLF